VSLGDGLWKRIIDFVFTLGVFYFKEDNSKTAPSKFILLELFGNFLLEINFLYIA